MTGVFTVPDHPRGVVNDVLVPHRVPRPGGAEVTDFHRRLPGYGPTPLHRLDEQARALGIGGLFVKDESDRFGLPAFKILGVSWAVEQTLRTNPRTRTLVAASAGNHGRAVARVAAQRSLACRIYLPAATSRSRAELIVAEGAEVVRVEGGYDDAVHLAERAAGQPDTALVADTARRPGADSPGWVVEGYCTLFREAAAQAPVPFDVVLVPVGVGSLAAAAVRWAVHEHPTAAVLAVEAASAACVAASLLAGEVVTVPTPGTSMAGLDCATPSAAAWATLRDGLAGTVSVSDPEAHRAMRDLAVLGLTVGDCGAATFAAVQVLARHHDYAPLRAATGLGPEANVLCLATEGASDPSAYRRRVASLGR